MKKRAMKIAAIAISVAMVASMAACGAKPDAAPADNAADAAPAADTSAPAEVADDSSAAPEVPDLPAICDGSLNFDFSADIAAQTEQTPLVPEAAAIDLAVEAASGATGVVIVPSLEEGNTADFYLNAYVAGDELTFTGAIASATSSVAGDLEVAEGAVKVTPAAISVKETVDEIITFTMEDGSEYNVHTINQLMPAFEATGDGVAAADAGDYSMSIDQFGLLVDTEGEILYYRDFSCNGINPNMTENFQKQVTKDGTFYTIFIELAANFRNANGGFSSGYYLVMDENFADIDKATLVANENAVNPHGQGYLDQHEFVVMGANHYLVLSYTPELVSNIPETAGTGGSTTGYVWAGIFQEIVDGQAVAEINTTDYPELYESAVEKCDYAGSTDKTVIVTVGQNEIPSVSEGWQDYVHVNSLDYTLNDEGNVDELLVSMRDQSAVFQFDMATGEIQWVLGGLAPTLTGYEEFTTDRQSDAGAPFKALTFGQHYARYMNKDASGKIDGPKVVSIFDNSTGTAPFLINPPSPIPTMTRTFVATIDEEAGTATIDKVINGVDMNEKTEKYHITSHCGSVDYLSDTSVTIGWGLHGVIDNIGAMAPEGTVADPDAGYPDLRQGSRPIFTDYNLADGTVAFELSVTRSPLKQTHEGLFSYRTYRTMK